jgi:type IV pilus biogenesis protein CpaD/CtpE
MNNKILIALAVSLLSGCSLVTPLSYQYAPERFAAPSYDVTLHNSQIDLDMNQHYTEQVIENALSALVTQAGHRVKQRVVVVGDVQSIKKHRLQMGVLLANVGVLPSQVNYRVESAFKSQQLRVISEYFEANSVVCQQGSRVRLGCASANLLSAMVVDPSTLIRGKTLGAADGTKAVNAIEKYKNIETKEADISRSFRASGGE